MHMVHDKKTEVNSAKVWRYLQNLRNVLMKTIRCRNVHTYEWYCCLVTKLCLTPWTAARQASLSITNSRSLLKLMSIESLMPSTHLILCRPLLLLPSIFPSIRVFSSESVLHIRWSKYWGFSFSISPSNEYFRLISFRIDWFDLLSVQGFSRVFSRTTIQKNQFFSSQPSLWSNSHIHT